MTFVRVGKVVHLLCLAIIACTVSQASAGYTLQVEVRTYSNPESKDYEGKCCDFSFINCGACEPDFRFCVRSYGTGAKSDTCPSTPVYYTDASIPGSPSHYTFNTQGEMYTGAKTNNPLTFSGSSWSGSFQFYVRIDDVDDNADDLIDRVAFNVVQTANGQWSSIKQQSGYYGIATIEARFKVGCNSNYYGQSCTTYCVATDSSSGGHFTCDSNGNKICNDGYSNPGNNCLTPICSAGCNQIGGYCDEPNECICRDGWEGADCNDCIALPGCSTNHGSCTAPNECICDEGYTGEFCTMDNDVCGHQQPCATGSTCTNTGPDQYLCSCTAGFTGQNCDIEIDECSPSPCLNGATCFDELNNFTCECAAGWGEKTCDVNIDDCDPDPCLNGANCTDLVNGYHCACTSGFYGPDCEGHFCDSSPCANDSTCVAVEGTYECHCPLGYTGALCDTEINECDSTPCQNGGTCTDLLMNYQCSCPTGFQGKDCQLDIDYCVSAQCSPHSVCVDQREGYTCYCNPGFTGVYCEVEIDECDPHPCQNGATCNDFAGYYTCHCASGFTGDHCEVNIDDCTPFPCSEGSTCQDLVSEYICICPARLTGIHCETNVSACESNPCRGGSYCLDDDNGGFLCQICTEGLCEIVDPENVVGSPTPSITSNNISVDWVLIVTLTVGLIILLLLLCAIIYVFYLICKERRRRKLDGSCEVDMFSMSVGSATVTENHAYLAPELLDSTRTATLKQSSKRHGGSVFTRIPSREEVNNPMYTTNRDKTTAGLLNSLSDESNERMNLLKTGTYDSLEGQEGNLYSTVYSTVPQARQSKKDVSSANHPYEVIPLLSTTDINEETPYENVTVSSPVRNDI